MNQGPNDEKQHRPEQGIRPEGQETAPKSPEQLYANAMGKATDVLHSTADFIAPLCEKLGVEMPPLPATE